MTRSRVDTAVPPLTVRNTSGPTPAASPAPLPSLPPGAGAGAGVGPADTKHLPSIRFIPHQDPRAGRPSLQFPAITRTLPDETSLIRVGRYSERDNLPDMPPHAPSAAAVGFKSKVVSRKHCELWYKDGSWYIRDVKSSSGTFLNHIRLSQPNVESKPFRIKDGDIIQLGIDFRGGEEMIFRCVKIRVECNRGWQQGLNNFNKQTHQRLRNLAKARKESDAASMHTSECAICLMSIAPCQSLFVAPCSHVWHYKCIRPILNGPTWPNFLCPNCRAVADLEEDVEEPDTDDWEANGEPMSKVETHQATQPISPRVSSSSLPLEGSLPHDNDHDRDREPENADLHHHNHDHQHENADHHNLDNDRENADHHENPVAANLTSLMANVSVADSLDEIANQPLPETPDRRPTPPPTSSVTQPIPIPPGSVSQHSGLSPLHPALQNALMPDRAPDGPMTPRNDVGPFVLDGSAGRSIGNHEDEEEDDDNHNHDNNSNNNNSTTDHNSSQSDPSSDSSSGHAPT